MTVIGHNHYLAQTVGELTPTETTALAPESLSIGIRVADLSVEAANFIVELANQQPADSARVYRVMAPGTNSAFLPQRELRFALPDEGESHKRLPFSQIRSTVLQHYKFLEKHLPLVRAMQCVPIPIEMEVFDWIRADAGGRGALDDIEKRNSEVWLYTETFDGTETAIGFAGYAPKKWNWPDADGPRVKHFHITNLGLDERYRGQPPGAREDRYAWQILDHLVNVCMNRIEADASFSPMLSLNVEQNNLRAISFYQQYGFNFLPRQIYIDEATGREYPGMIFRF